MAWDVRGKTAIVTGATSGIGFHVAIDLARRGARVVIVGRDRQRTDDAAAEIARILQASTQHQAPSTSQVSSLLCDFSSQAETRRLADAFRERHDRLDILVNNAGGVSKTRRTTVDGVEMTFAVNHLGPFLLTNLLLDLIVRSAPARIVTVASIGHRNGSMNFDDLGFERGYWIMRAYSRSKLANVLFATELARRLEGTGVTSNSVHPGSVDTRIWSGAPVWTKPMIQLLMRPFFISAERGGGYVAALATRSDLTGVSGKYFEEDRMVAPSPLAEDRALARRLWEVSASMTGLSQTGANAGKH